MKRGFSLIELIFSVVIISILIGVAFYSFKPKYLRNDANFVLIEILKAKYNGINNILQNSRGCFYPDRVKDTAKKSNYIFRSEIEGPVVCFDRYGEAYVDSAPINSEQNITLNYNNEELNISIYPKSGYVTIRD